MRRRRRNILGGNTRSATWSERRTRPIMAPLTDRPNDPRSVFPIGDALITPPIQKYRRTHRQIDSWHVSQSRSFSSLGDCLGKKDTRRKRAIFFFFKGKTRDVVMDRPKITTAERQRGRRV